MRLREKGRRCPGHINPIDDDVGGGDGDAAPASRANVRVCGGRGSPGNPGIRSAGLRDLEDCIGTRHVGISAIADEYGIARLGKAGSLLKTAKGGRRARARLAVIALAIHMPDRNVER